MPELTLVEQLSGAPLMTRLLALPANIGLYNEGSPETDTLDYL
jgi:hypothetical protein